MTHQHPDYPLLLPLTVARLWRYTGGTESTVVPFVAAAIITAASVALLGAGVAQVRGRAQGWLAALALLAMSSYLQTGACQYADIPLAFFQLAAIVCMVLALRREQEDRPRYAAGMWTIAGLCAGGALWTKNEGALFAAAFLVTIVSISLLGKNDSVRTLGRLSRVSLGLFPAVVTLIAFKLKHPFPNDILSSFDRAAAGRIFDPKRNLEVLYYLGRAVLGSPDRIPTLLVLAYAALSAAQIARAGSSLGASEHIALAAGTVCLILVGAGFYSIYLITPYPLAWHVSTSALRLWQQLLPSALFVIFVGLPPAEKVLGRQRLWC